MTGAAGGATPLLVVSGAVVDAYVGRQIGRRRGEVGLEPDVACGERVGGAPQFGRVVRLWPVGELLVEVVDPLAPELLCTAA